MDRDRETDRETDKGTDRKMGMDTDRDTDTDTDTDRDADNLNVEKLYNNGPTKKVYTGLVSKRVYKTCCKL